MKHHAQVDSSAVGRTATPSFWPESTSKEPFRLRFRLLRRILRRSKTYWGPRDATWLVIAFESLHLVPKHFEKHSLLMARSLASLITSVLLLGSAVLVMAVPDLPSRLAGFRPLAEPEPSQLDAGLAADDRDAPRFLAERNRVDLVVPRDMDVGQLLDLYQIRMDHIRQQIASQLGLESAPDTTPLRQGQRLELQLTPGSAIPAPESSPADPGAEEGTP